MAPSVFSPKDRGALVGPPEAFDEAHPRNSSKYAMLNHLALEVASHLGQEGVVGSFRGGTALHSKLGGSARHSVDVDIEATDPGMVERALEKIVRRFPNSGIIRNKPTEMERIEGTVHVLRFGEGRYRVQVEVVASADPPFEQEPLRLRADGFEWSVGLSGPTFEAFTGQKLSTLGPTTIGKRVGPGSPGSNQAVAKQIFDLGELLRLEMDPGKIRESYQVAVAEANRLRSTGFSFEDGIMDASALLSSLQAPKQVGRAAGPLGHGLWQGYEDSRRYIASRSRWDETRYRVTGGVIHRLALHLGDESVDWDRLRAPAIVPELPERVRTTVSEALRRNERWVPDHRFGENPFVAWAWSPREYW